MKRIGVFGGTFNPIHNGHLHIASCFAEELSLDRVLLIPSKRPTHKPSPDLAKSSDRLAMCRLAVEGTPFEVSNLEVARQEESYTVYTLEALRQQYPGDQLFLLVGEDMFLTLLDWREGQRICQMATVCAAPRSDDGRERLLSYGKKIEEAGGTYWVGTIPFLPVSSTEVRQCLQAGKPIDHLVPKRVADYLYQHHLYTGGMHHDKRRI